MDDIEYEGRARLARIRRDPEAWREVTCLESSDAEGLWTDAHAANRYALLLALQYDLQSDDRDLVRFLFEQEALLLAQTLASEKADAARGMPMDGRRAGSRAQGWRLCICWRSRWQPLPP
jgi:hypothetical protein